MLLARNRGWIGVDVGTHAVKMAQVVRCRDDFVLADAAVIQRLEPWDAGPLDSHVLSSHEEILVGHMLAERFTGCRAAASLPMALCQLKSMQIPDGTPDVRREAIGRELAKTPVAGDATRVFDYWPINNRLENATIVRENVNVISLASQWATRIAEDHRQAKMECRALDAVPLALARAIQMNRQIDQMKPIAVLDWGFSRATFSVVLEGRPLFVRCLRDCEFGMLVRALRSALDLNWDEARRLAVDYGGGAWGDKSADELQAMVSEIALTTISALNAELQRTLVYLQMHRPKLVPEEMWLFGGGAAVKGVASLLARHVELDVQCWNLGEAVFHSDTAGSSPVAMLGPAIALSCLAWEGV